MSKKRIYVLTGAGISVESGVPAYRSTSGIWQKNTLRDVATAQAFADSPDRVWKFISALKRQINLARPNAAHRAIAQAIRRSEQTGVEIFLVTQNIDGLHEQALSHEGIGHSKCIAMHGRISSSHCTGCGKKYNDPYSYYDEEGFSAAERLDSLSFDPTLEFISTPSLTGPNHLPVSPCCNRLLKPSVVLFGEEPDRLNECYGGIKDTMVFIAIGTSAQVFPAADFVKWAVRLNPRVRALFVNTHSSDATKYFNEFITRPAGESVPELLENVINSLST